MLEATFDSSFAFIGSVMSESIYRDESRTVVKEKKNKTIGLHVTSSVLKKRHQSYHLHQT